MALLKPNTGTDNMVSLPALLRRNAASFGSLAAFREKEFGIWQTWSWAKALEGAENFALGLIELGIQPGDFVAVLGRNRPDLYISMIAIQMTGATPVPQYQDSVAEEMEYVLAHCGAKFVVAGDQEQVDKILEIQTKLPAFEQMIYLDGRGLRKYDHSKLHSFSSVIESGKNSGQNSRSILNDRESALNYKSTCVMLYTSGTTGRPKGVVLSNANIIETAKTTCEFDNLKQSDEILAYLPMAWIGDFIFSVGQAMWSGFCVNCPESADTLSTDLREIGPTYYFAPPRVFEMQLTNVMIRMEDSGRFKKWLFDYFMEHARRVGADILDGKSVGLGNRIKYFLGDLTVYGPLKNTLGLSKVRVGYTAGEAIGPEIFDFYRSLGINLKQLYGQTEASVYITQQPDGEVRGDTVGVPTPGVEVRIGDNGEVYYRSPGTFVEYYKNPKSTADTKDPEGWVATGDAGFFEEDTGHLRIIDRAKDVAKMSDGSMFAPKYVENKLKFYPNILEAVVFGAGKERCVAFVNIDLSAVGNWAERNNIAYSSYQELAGHTKVLEMVKEHIEEVNVSISEDKMLAGCQVHRFIVLHKELDADDGELTRTRKVRRKIIGEKFKDLVTALYDGSGSVYTETEVTYEDGRKGKISANLDIVDAKVINQANIAAE